MDHDNLRSVELERSAVGRFVVRNARGGEMPLGSGEDDAFTPVELLLAAIGGCTGIDADLVTSRRSEPARFVISFDRSYRMIDPRPLDRAHGGCKLQ